jgi:putative DNA primase/helicase
MPKPKREQQPEVVDLAEHLAARRRDALPFADDGNARRLALDHGDDLRFLAGVGWFRWDGVRWRRDLDGGAMRAAKVTIRGLLEQAARTEDKDRAERLFKFGITSLSRSHLEAMVALAASEEALLVEAADLDADDFLLNVENGTLDLTTGRLREHRREDRITKIAPVPFEPEAACPRWLNYLDASFRGDADLIAYVQRCVGYTLTGDTGEQCLFIVQGDGENGKTTAVELLGDLLGDYATVIDPALLMAATRPTSPGAPRPDLVRLHGARYVPAVEVEQGAQLAEALIKQLTGGSTITARELHQKGGIEFRPAFKLWLDANHLPHVRGTDHAIWRRLRVIPYLHRVERPDRHLPAVLRAEAPGILAWAVRGCLDWQRHGLGEPVAVRDATADYRQEQDTVANFLDARCELADDGLAPAGLLYEAYKNHCANRDLAHLPVQSFKSALLARGVTHRKTKKGAFYEGVRL